MKKNIMFFVVIAAVTLLSLPVGEAAVFQADSPVTLDTAVVFTQGEIDPISHAVVTFNNADDTAFAIILDPSGFPDDFPADFAFLFADFFTGTLYGSNDGVNWVILGPI